MLRPLLLLATACAAFCARADFALRDGDTVVFLGDSITAARGYTKIVEHYTLMRFPERQVHFWNAGHGGDTAEGARQRLERDVFSHGATVVIVAFGVNDIGWGMKADEEHRQRYLEAVRGIVAECQRRKVRVFLCSAAITAEAPDKAETGFLQKMTDEGLDLAKSLDAGAIDLQRGMREIQRRVLAANEAQADAKDRSALHVADGVHLSDLGQLAMAFAMLQGLGAPAEVSSVEIDAATHTLLAAEGCEVTAIEPREHGLAFTRLDRGLPLNLGILSGLNYRFVPLPDGINRYLLTVKNLAPGAYEIRAENRLLGKADARQLAKGQNISSMTADGWEPGGPWDAQSNIVKELVEARDRLWMSAALRTRFADEHPQAARLAQDTQELDARLHTLQHSTARPYLYRFEIRRVEK